VMPIIIMMTNNWKNRPFQRPTSEDLLHGRALFATLVAFCFIFLATFSSGLMSAQSVQVGIYQNKPKIFLDTSGNPAGFFVDILEAIAKAEDWEIQFVPCTWDECLLRLENGDLDLMADVAYTSEREKRFDFGQEVVFASWSVVYAKPKSSIESVLDLKNKKVVVLRDSVQSRVLRQLTETFAVSPDFIEVTSFEEGYKLVESSEADAIAVNRFFGKMHESIYSARPTDILIAPALVKFAAPIKNQRVLLNVIDGHLFTLRKDNNSIYYQAFNRWFEPTKTISLPSWLKWSLISVAIVFLVLFFLLLVFRRMVRHKTRELEQSKGYLERLSYFDPITELPNRALFLDRLEQAAQKLREGTPHLAVFFIDLDDFKQINDSVGHEVGDKILKLVAERFAAHIRNEDTLARLGGDEFTVLIQSLHNPDYAATVAKKLLETLREPFQILEHSFYISASIGISLLPQDGADAKELLRNADAAMYQAKKEGRSTFRFYTEEMTAHAVEQLSLITGLREGLQKNEFFLYFQPLFNLESRTIVGVEALVRWKHGTDGLVPPDKFIPLAEESGVIFSLGEYVLRKACEQMVQWRRDGIAPERIAVNLSGKQFQRGDLVEIVTRILKETGCQASWLELEVTEGFIMITPELSISEMQQLRDMGIGLSIDDFGTGYSSLTYLKKLPISRLKIDRSFVRDIHSDSNDAAIAGAVIALGESLDLTVLAEGIETEEQYSFLQQQGCNEGQGYFLGRPIPAREMSERLALKADLIVDEHKPNGYILG